MINSPPRRLIIALSWILIFVFINILILTGINGPALSNRYIATLTLTATQTFTPTLSPTPTQTPSPTTTKTPTPTEPSILDQSAVKAGPLSKGVMVMSLVENGYAHLFAFQPELIPLTRLTAHNWDDVEPAISPDGTHIAFRSRQNGYWDIDLLDLATGTIKALTDTPEYDGAPSFSPDGQWIVYESYTNNNFELFIRQSTPSKEAPIQLTNDPAQDISPTWSPQGRLIAFISTRSGSPQIWLADLDRVEGRFSQLTHLAATIQLTHPAWSPDGNRLAWSETRAGSDHIMVWDVHSPDSAPVEIGSGDWPVWSAEGDILLSHLRLPVESFITAYQVGSRNIILPPLALIGAFKGLDWKPLRLTVPLPTSLEITARLTPSPLWISQVTPLAAGPSDRQSLVTLKDVTAPNPRLLDSVDEAFQMLRSRVANELGWDFLASLENAFVPLNSPLPPGSNEDWLLTGRAFTVNPVPMSAGWMIVTREEIGSLTYWRIFVRTRYQDGSMGAPMRSYPWDLNARYSGDPQVYEEGGQLSGKIPSGYFIDFTDLAQTYSFQRLPAQLNWRTYFPGIRYNEFAMTENMDWKAAMLEVYPQEIMLTPTVVLPPTATPTVTPRGYLTRVPTSTRTPTITPTSRPTWTPVSP